MARKGTKAFNAKVGDTINEFKRGKLRSGSGAKVTKPSQAKAIALKQARKAGRKK
jgi:hypothetical protein